MQLRSPPPFANILNIRQKSIDISSIQFPSVQYTTS